MIRTDSTHSETLPLKLSTQASHFALVQSKYEFDELTQGNGVDDTLVAPYHHRSNGQTEGFVQTFKYSFKGEVRFSAY